jgi:ubiquinone/menaquinone biosynthesis C-methylase UbiE
MTVKDNFSKQSAGYSIYRPGYPETLYEFILSHTPARKFALDVATGNGQVAAALSNHFEKVFAIDISEKQLSHSIQKSNIIYSIARAEHTGIDEKVDLVTVGQAAHWFELKAFYKEAQRIINPGSMLALFGYQLPTIDAAVDAVIEEFYNGLLGSFWDPERKLVDEGYESLYFPFKKMEHPKFEMNYSWTCDQLLGFLGTWSAVQHYKNKHDADPIDLFKERIAETWGKTENKKITFPVFLLATKFD